jgi:dTDP-4-dehydrorhamnose 3,5-epimerase
MDGVILTPLKQIRSSKGSVLHAMKKGDEGYAGFGEAYFSTINKGDIKGWKKHIKMTLNLIVPVGKIEFVVYNEKHSEFFNVILSQDNYQRLTVRPGFWVAFKGLSENNILLNLASVKHDSSETINTKLDDINYSWIKESNF